MKGFVHILKATSEQVPGDFSYAVIFAPVRPAGTGGAVPSKNLKGKDDLVDFLGRMRIRKDSIKNALQNLEINGNASIPFVELPEDELRILRLMA